MDTSGEEAQKAAIGRIDGQKNSQNRWVRTTAYEK
jgi:hypothetical protein